MRYLYSTLEKREYLIALKNRLESSFRFFDERVTGIVIGPFFSVAHYAPWEWNRKITSECNRAFGFVKTVEGETEIAFIRSKGLFSPFWLLFITLLCELLWVFLTIQENVDVEISGWGVSAVLSFAVCVLTAWQASITEEGEAGAKEVTKLLKNPKEYL